MEKTIFNGFFLNGTEYYFYKGKYYVDNGTVRQKITVKEYRKAINRAIEG